MSSKLPHDLLQDASYHITYRLKGSLPHGEMSRISQRRSNRRAQLEAEALYFPQAKREAFLQMGFRKIDRYYEVAIDRALHATGKERYHLAQPGIAGAVLQSWQWLHERREITLQAVCVMGNHVHVVLTMGASEAEIPLGDLLRRHKTFTARVANRFLDRRNQPFWEAGYFDRRIRKGNFMRAVWYVLNNPVAAGLCTDWEDWPHTWTHPELRPMFTGRIERAEGLRPDLMSR